MEVGEGNREWGQQCAWQSDLKCCHCKEPMLCLPGGSYWHIFNHSCIDNIWVLTNCICTKGDSIHLHFSLVSLWGEVKGWVLWDPNGSLHGGQQAIPPFTPQGWAEALWASDEQLDHDTSIFFHTFTWGKELFPLIRKDSLRISFFLFLKDFMYLLLERGEKRERNIDVWEKHWLLWTSSNIVWEIYHPHYWVPGPQPGHVPDWELNLQPFGSQASAQSS